MNPNQFSRGAIFYLVLLLSAILVAGREAQGASEKVEHFGATSVDELLGCIHRVYGKPVIRDLMVRDVLVTPCPSSKELVAEAAKAKGLLFLEDEEWIFLAPANYFAPRPPYSQEDAARAPKQHSIKVETRLDPAKEMSEEQAKDILNVIKREARMPPIFGSQDPWKMERLVITLNVRFLLIRLGEGLPESVVTIISEPSDIRPARLIYGELQSGKYKALWDSPWFESGSIDFVDVNGDGEKEILIKSETAGANSVNVGLVVFDRKGRELSRQELCGSLDSVPAVGAACPIIGTNEISVTENVTGPKQILAGDGEVCTYQPEKAVFVCPSQTRASILGIAAQSNEKGLRQARKGDYQTALTYFMGAAGRAPDNAEYANNVGFAYYRLGDYENAVTWLYKATEIDPKRAVAYLNLGDALVKLNQHREPYAREAYQKYLELAPNSKLAPEVKKKLDALPSSH
jgi:hypothetical protein